jgi:von Willebrand factor type A domain
MSNTRSPHMPIDVKPPKSPLRNLQQPPASSNVPMQPASSNVPAATAPKPSLRSVAHRTVGDIGKVSQNPRREYLLLDRSGSMTVQWEKALGAINTYARHLGSKGVNTRIMMATFDDQHEVIRKELHPLQWRPVTEEEVAPRGGTALNDAIGRLAAQAKQDNPAKAAIAIMTDGGENASKEVTDEQAKALLDECRARGWDVIFLGMGHDNSGLAQQYGADPSQTIAATKESLAMTMQKLAEKVATGQRISFSDAEKKDAGGRLLLGNK